MCLRHVLLITLHFHSRVSKLILIVLRRASRSPLGNDETHHQCNRLWWNGYLRASDICVCDGAWWQRFERRSWQGEKTTSLSFFKLRSKPKLCKKSRLRRWNVRCWLQGFVLICRIHIWLTAICFYCYNDNRNNNSATICRLSEEKRTSCYWRLINVIKCLVVWKRMGQNLKALRIYIRLSDIGFHCRNDNRNNDLATINRLSRKSEDRVITG
jgi:hypothetical protein